MQLTLSARQALLAAIMLSPAINGFVLPWNRPSSDLTARSGFLSGGIVDATAHDARAVAPLLAAVSPGRKDAKPEEGDDDGDDDGDSSDAGDKPAAPTPTGGLGGGPGDASPSGPGCPPAGSGLPQPTGGIGGGLAGKKKKQPRQAGGDGDAPALPTATGGPGAAGGCGDAPALPTGGPGALPTGAPGAAPTDGPLAGGGKEDVE